MAPPQRAAKIALADGAASVVVDDGAWPIVVATWFGEPTVPLVDRYFEHHDGLLERARSAQQRIVLVTDTFATERASASVRRRIVERTQAQPRDAAQLTLKSYVVLDSAIMRGVVTALAWVYPALGQSENVGALSTALERAMGDLRAAGVTPPSIDPARATRPERPSPA